MNTKKTKVVRAIAIIAVLVVGYFAGAIIGWPIIDIDSTSGDIGKVRRNQQDVAVNLNTDFDKQLISDSVFLQETEFIQCYILSRSAEFVAISKQSMEAMQNIPDFSEVNALMQQINQLGLNAENASLKAVAALDGVVKGEGDGSFEQLSKNAIIAFLMLDNTASQSKNYVKAVDEFLKDKKVDDYVDLAFSRDLWVNFNFVSASVNQDVDLLEYWASFDNLLPENLLLEEIENSSPEDIFALYANGNINQQIVSSFIASQEKLEKRSSLLLSQEKLEKRSGYLLSQEKLESTIALLSQEKLERRSGFLLSQEKLNALLSQEKLGVVIIPVILSQYQLGMKYVLLSQETSGLGSLPAQRD